MRERELLSRLYDVASSYAPRDRDVVYAYIQRIKYQMARNGELAAAHYAQYHRGNAANCVDGCSAGQPW